MMHRNEIEPLNRGKYQGWIFCKMSGDSFRISNQLHYYTNLTEMTCVPISIPVGFIFLNLDKSLSRKWSFDLLVQGTAVICMHVRAHLHVCLQYC